MQNEIQIGELKTIIGNTFTYELTNEEVTNKEPMLVDMETLILVLESKDARQELIKELKSRI